MRTVINPGEARRFASMLKERADEIRHLNAAVTRRLIELHSSSWNDSKYDRFERRYDEASVLLKMFSETAERYAEYLNEKAARIEPYLERKY